MDHTGSAEAAWAVAGILRRRDGASPLPACRWQTGAVRISHFWTLMDDEFGAGYAGSLARDHVLGALGNRTVVQALADGEPPRAVWEAICVDMDVPPERRLGRDARVARGAQGGQAGQAGRSSR